MGGLWCMGPLYCGIGQFETYINYFLRVKLTAFINIFISKFDYIV